MKKPYIAALAVTVASITLFAAHVASASDTRLVRGEGYGASDNWEVKKFPDVPNWHNRKLLGFDYLWFLPKSGYWTTQLDGADKLAMTEHVWLKLHGWFGINDIVTAINIDTDKEHQKTCYAAWTPNTPKGIAAGNKWKKHGDRTAKGHPVTFDWWLKKTLDEKNLTDEFLKRYPGHPVSAWAPDLRPLFFLSGEYDLDIESYRKWKSAHPSFIGFAGFCEFDGELASMFNHVLPKVKGHTPDIYRRITDRYPPPRDARELCDYCYRLGKNISAFYFGETNLQALVSNAPHRFFLAARATSLNHLEYEAAMGSCSGPFRQAGVYMRGCGRQYDIPYGWYIATWMSYCPARDGKNRPGDLQLPYGKPGSRTAKFRPYYGAPRSLLKRSNFYGLMIGSCSTAMEKLTDFFIDQPSPDAPMKPSFYMLDFNEAFEINKKIERGYTYTPLALLGSLEEGYNRSQHTPSFKDRFSLLAFFNTLVPLNVRKFEQRFMAHNRDEGDVGCMWNSEFGEIVDGLVPDADQSPARFAKVLADYPAALLCGWFNRNHFDRASVEQYVRGGGTLYCDSDKLDQGLVSAELTGVTFAADTLPAANEVKVRGQGQEWKTVFSFDEPYAYRKGTATTAKPYLVDLNGGVIAWANSCGKGRVITFAVDRLLPVALNEKRIDYGQAVFSITSSKRTFPLYRHVLREVQEQHLPVTVEGDIQWGVNKTSKGWLVWLINNKGVVKFAGEPEELDPKAASTVKVTHKATGKVYEKTVAPGGYGWIAL